MTEENVKRVAARVKPELTQERLKELLHYDPETGIFVRKVATGRHGCNKAGVIVGCTTKRGPIVISVDSKNYPAHHLAWLWCKGTLPGRGINIRHIDDDKENNRIGNLCLLADKSGELTHERLKKLLSYNPETGEWTRLKSVKGQKAGTKVGCIAHGYEQICVDNKQYYAHRLAWFYVYGVWPDDQIDHRNVNRASNALENLRQANNAQNVKNRPAPRTNTSGVKGVYWNKNASKWMAAITANGKRMYLGLFTDINEAAAVYAKAAELYHGEFARTK